MIIKGAVLPFALLGVFLLGVNLSHARDDIQWWQWINLNLWQEGPHKVHLYLENRLVDDMSAQRFWLASIRYKYQATEKIQIGAGYTYLDIHNIPNDTWMYRQRLELEATYKTEVSETLKFDFRNRLETWWDQDERVAEYRSRHRIQLSRSLNLGRLDAIYVNTEVFYLYEPNLLNEVRTVPVGLRFKLTAATKLSLFYMIQSTRSLRDRSWSHNHGIGTYLNYTF